MGGLFVTIFLALCVGAVVAKSTCSGSTCPDAAKGGNLLQAKRSTVLTQNEGSAFDPEVFALEVALDDRKPFKPQFSPEVTALLAQLHNDSSADDLNPACKRRSLADTKGVSKAVENNVLVMNTAKSHSNSSVSGCPGGQYQLMNFGPSGATKTCCPASSLACAGCASMSGSSCQQCQDGFVSRNGACIACSSGAWFNDQGKSCFHLVPSECNDVKVKGQSSNQACCQCGGGVLTPTPFSYPNVRWALDSEISILPEPRTAQRYTVDAACELSVHNLTMDSATGAISYISGRRKPTEAFSFECEVTAHQTATISATAVMVVAADFFTYKSSSLLFHTGDVENPILTGSAWSKFELGCAPEISWLSINSNTGTLTYTGSSGSPGGLSVVEDKFFGQDGAVCTVLAWKEGKQYKTTFASIRPRPWPTLQYSSSSVMVTVGEELLPLVPTAVRSHQGLMKPWTYTIACSVSGALPSTKFTYDRILSMGFIDGYEVLEIGEDGQIIVAPESTLSEIFDALSISGSQRKAMILSCRVFGLFPDPMIDPVETTLTINVQDTMCWVPQTLNQAVAVPDAAATSEAQCRSSCRRDPTCANYKFHSNTCNRYDAQSAGGSATTVIAKVTNCTNEGSCVEVQHTKWWLSGIYCPLGRDVDAGRIVYMRGHVTSKDIIYLRESAAASEGCTAGQYILQTPSSGDFMDKSRGIFELRGQVKSCVNSITFAVQPCSTKALAFVEEEEKDEEGLPALILDDPSTAASADFWLHPCECAPSAWGTASPVNPKSFEQVPVDSQNDFIPSPFTIVTGQLVCPSRQLLPGVGVHFQSEEETMEPADCEARCRNHDDCHFFWHGSQHGASTCRLFNGCDNLVREFSLEGSLYAMPRSSSCLMADAERCWATSLRRSFLSMASRGSSGTASTGGATGGSTGGLNLPSNPGNPPSQGMVAWFKSENAGSVWPSSVGNIAAVASVNSVFRTVGAGYGADRAVTYIQGNHRSQFRFGGPGEVLKPTYTICSVTRYAGEIAGATQRKRILQTDKVDWLHGHWNDYSGIAYYQSWVSTDASQLANTKNTMSFDWVVLCGTNGAQRLYELQGSPGTATNIAVNRVINTHPSDSTLYVNGGFGGSETSDFAVMEVITWDRALSDAEMTASVDYLKWKLRVGAVLEVSEHLATEYQKNMDSFGNQNLADVASQTFDVPLANGHRADLSGWTHTMHYARGFLRNTDGTATAVVKSLTPAAKYIYSVYMVHEVSNWQGEAKVSVNHGAQSRVYQGGYSIPVLSGVATATPNGEINFGFQRVSHHVHLTAISIAAVGDASVPKPQDPPSQGMVAWFKSENAGSVWPSSVGNIEGVASVNSVFRTVGAGYGADRAVTYIQGNHRSQFRFGGPGEVLKPTYTICSVTRYAGEIAGATQRKRILQTDKVNWLHGHWHEYAGIAYYQSWVSTDESQLANTKNTMRFDWVVLCGTNGAQRLYELQGSPGTATNIAVNRVINTHPSDSTLYVNGGYYGSETSDFAVMEVITWDRALSDAEMTASVEYLKWKLRVGAVLEVSEHLATEYQKNMDSFGNQNLADVASQTFDVPLANGHRADLSGWTHTMSYARGFLRNTDGTATAVVKSLTPAAKYIYSVYMVHEVSNWKGEAKVSVNHGPQSRVYQGGYSIPVLSGVATATPRGEINFEFQRVSHHVHLTAIAIAAVDASVATLQESSQLLELANGAVDSGFLHLHLYQQCDAVLLLGGMGVQECGRPGHRNTTSHEWQHKRPLPKAFQSGAVLLASCWTERYRLLKGSNVVPSERLQCVNGDWINSLGATSLKGLACESCVQVGASGYAAFDERDEQELYFMNRMSLSIYTELGMIKELSTGSKHRYCLSKGTSADMTVTASASCPAGLLARVTAKSSPENRQFKLIPADFAADADECLESREETDQKVAGLKHLTCNVSAPKQLLLPAELPLDMWNLHILADQRTQDLHKGYSSYCGTSGALSALDFGQLFVGDHQDVTNAASRCKFAPLIQFGDFQDTGILRQKSSSNWNAWHDLLADNPVECKDGEALTGFKLEASQNKYRYECSKIGGLGACFDYYSAQVEVPSFGQAKANWEKPMRMLTVNCGQNSVLGAFHFEFSEGGKWGRVRYQCCKAGGAPVTFDPRGQVGQLMSTFDGTFCPSGRDASDRLMYQAGSQTLTFNRDGGKWCVGTDCSEVTDMATPLGLMTSNWEVVNVSDFNGAFEGQMPKEKNSQSLEDILGNLKKPKRPKAPPMPELEEFKAEQPKYAAECLNYQNLWKSVTETFRDDEDNDMEKTDKLLPEPSTEGSELDDYHPCEVAKGAGGVFGSFGGGDGSTAPENMMYADWNNCMQGDINRDLGFAKLDWNGARNGFIWDMVATSAKAFCFAIPDVIVSPFGTGFGLRPSKICEGAVKLQKAARAFAGPSMAYGSAQKRWAMEQEDWNACNPLQVGFARLFCDVHCVRDAVIRGDRSIIRNLEKATKKTNNNMAALVKWSVDSARTETGWIADKIDYANTVSTAYLKEIRTMLQSKSTSLVEGTQVASGMMLKELAGYAEAASFDDLSRITARSALEQFLETPDFTSSSNASEASKILGHLDQLHATLRRVGSRSKEEVFSRQLGRNIKQLQQQAQLQLHTLGVYRLASETSSHQSRAMSRHRSGAMVERHEVMMSIDHIWWTLRKKLDEYLRAAEDEVQSFQASLEEMSSYMDCKKGFKRLIASYTTSMANMKRSHRQLRDAWREGSYLLGELASVIVDTDAFQTFVREQGCKSSYMEQTLKQLDSAVFDMAFLFHRFRASHLPEPDTFALKEATQRIQQAASAVDHCTQ